MSENATNPTNPWSYRTITGLAFAAALGVVLVTVMVIVHPNPAIAQAREESIRRLAGAGDPEAMENAVGSLGIVFHLADQSWIAIRYVDRHHGDFWSSGVALDSKGR